MTEKTVHAIYRERSDGSFHPETWVETKTEARDRADTKEELSGGEFHHVAKTTLEDFSQDARLGR